MYACVHCNIIHNSQAMETTQNPVHKWTGKEKVVNTYNAVFYSAL